MSAPPTPAQRRLFEDVWVNGLLEEHLDAVYGNGSPPPRLTGIETGPRLTHTKLALARASGRTSRASGRGGGTAAPGRLLLRMAPSALATMAARLPDGVALVSATNGKTTTARMLAAILEADGRRVVHNRAGANTHWGVSTALAEDTGDIGVFEVDEAWLSLLAGELSPRLLVLGNLFRDRLDAYGELDRLVGIWRGLIGAARSSSALVVNADDPLLAGPGGVLDGARAAPLLFGIGNGAPGAASPDHPHEAHTCRSCGSPMRYSRAFVGHLGHYACSGCRGRRPAPAVQALEVQSGGLGGSRVKIATPSATFDVTLRIPGLHNVYNALGATAAAIELGVGHEAIRSGLQSVAPPFGRGERLRIGETRVHLLLVKNPVGVNATMGLLCSEGAPRPLDMWLGLNDEHADGRDVSWIWDADFERLAPHVGRVTCAGGRAAELALRLKYAGWRSSIAVHEDLEGSFRAALGTARGTLVALPTYSVLLGLREVLRGLGVHVSDWDRR